MARGIEWIFVAYFAVDIVIGVLFDIEPWMIPDASKYDPSKTLWPPEWAVRLSHWFGQTHDPLLLARPLWFRAMILIRVVLVPLEAGFLVALLKDQEWIRVPGVMYGSAIAYSTVIVMVEGLFGAKSTSTPIPYLAAYISYVVIPALFAYSMATKKTRKELYEEAKRYNATFKVE
eukprot:tig00020564_g11422.t1